jgi:hypothetical protein
MANFHAHANRSSTLVKKTQTHNSPICMRQQDGTLIIDQDSTLIVIDDDDIFVAVLC